MWVRQDAGPRPCAAVFGRDFPWMEPPAMSLVASPRREKRRRLIALWGRSETSAPAPQAVPGRPAAYAPAATPERQPSLAALVPCGLGRFAAVAAGMLATTAVVLALAVWQRTAVSPAAAPGRFAATLAAARACLDPASVESLGGFLAECWLFTAAVGALVVRSMRRHRRDDFQGRYRAWAWMACLFVTTACAGRMPLGRLAAAAGSDLTGVALGPSGSGWWMLSAAVAWIAVGCWAVVPLHERLATALWLAGCYAAWTVTAACTLLAGRPGSAPLETAATTSWVFGAALAAIAMLAAARSVIREVRGLPAREEAGRASTESRPVAPRQQSQPAAATVAATAAPEAVRARLAVTDGADEEEDEEGDGERHLSKAERRRLRKLARANRAAA